MSNTEDLNTDANAVVLRRRIRSSRASLSSSERARLDAGIRCHVAELVASRTAISVAAYWPFDGEPDLIPLCREWLESGVEVALPVIFRTRDNRMEFHAWHWEMRLEKNRFGIFEPRPANPIPVAAFDILLMPLVAFDGLGNRIGMGAGFYDRHLEATRDAIKPLRVGVAYGLQEVETIAGNDWDVPLHGVVTEHGWLRFGNRANPHPGREA